MEKTSTLTAEEKAFFMEEAIKEARKAEGLAEVPIGAVVVLVVDTIYEKRSSKLQRMRRCLRSKKPVALLEVGA